AVTAVSEDGAQPVTVSVAVQDASGHTVATASAPAALGDTPVSTDLDLRLDDPQLWSPEHPYLYTAVTRIQVDGRTVDQTSTPFGLRWFAFDPDHGLSLNGRPTKLHGVNLHHDLGALGAAVNPDAVRRQLTIMRSMGVNALRTSHNPPSPQMVQACQELGVLM